jgi:hypothetical protein
LRRPSPYYRLQHCPSLLEDIRTMNDHLGRNYIDCRDFPSDSKCSLRIEGTRDEVLAAAVQHAVSAHGHSEGPALRESLATAVRGLK